MPLPEPDHAFYTPARCKVYTRPSQDSCLHKCQRNGVTLALDALRREFEQFRALDVLEPLDAFTLTEEQKAESL